MIRPLRVDPLTMPTIIGTPASPATVGDMKRTDWKNSPKNKPVVYIAGPMRKPRRYDVRRWGLRNSRKGRIGSGARRSWRMNSAKVTAASENPLMMGTLVHPRSCPCSRESMNAATQVVSSAAPLTSTTGRRLGGGTRRTLARRANATIPSGRLTRKIHRQLALSTMTPPTSGPSTAAIPHIDENRPKYLPRSRGGTMSPTVAKVRPQMPPPPMPCRARAAINCGMVCAAPHSNEANKNRPIVKSSNRRRP